MPPSSTGAAQQHEEVLAAAARAEEAVARWGQEGAPSQESCVERLTALGKLVGEHLDEEEEKLLPLCAAQVTTEEWGAQPPHGMALFSGDKVRLIIGLIRQRMSESQRRDMLAHMPPPAVEMWTGFGEKAFTQLIAEVGAPWRRAGAPRRGRARP
jgi:hypothetical protein